VGEGIPSRYELGFLTWLDEPLTAGEELANLGHLKASWSGDEQLTMRDENSPD
jgi:hypothetical protein